MTLAYAVVRPNLQQVEYYLVTLISTYKTILYFYALRPTDRLAVDLQNYPDTGVYCYAARDKMR